jgi:hypothetical protein
MICPREDELLDALDRGFVGAELTAHVAACAACHELRTVAGALLDVEATSEAHVPAAGTMWWRMQLRRRQEATATARRTLLIGQAATLAIALALVVSFFGPALATGAHHLADTLRLSKPILMLLAFWVVAAPIGGWVAVRGK